MAVMEGVRRNGDGGGYAVYGKGNDTVMYISISYLCNYGSTIDVIIYPGVQYHCSCELFSNWMVPFFSHRGEMHLCTNHCTTYN